MIGKHKNGVGILITRKSCFEGEWKGNAKVKGVEVTHQGVYKGHYVLGKREGTGQYHRHAGDIYVGEWKAGKQHGTGLWIDELGSSYNGSWVQGKVEGMGTLSLKSKFVLIQKEIIKDGLSILGKVVLENRLLPTEIASKVFSRTIFQMERGHIAGKMAAVFKVTLLTECAKVGGSSR